MYVLALSFLFFLSPSPSVSLFFFFNDTATTEIYTLSLHDALPISEYRVSRPAASPSPSTRASAIVRNIFRSGSSHRLESNRPKAFPLRSNPWIIWMKLWRSEEHTSELQSLTNLVCRLLLEKKKTTPHAPSERGRLLMFNEMFRKASRATLASQVEYIAATPLRAAITEVEHRRCTGDVHSS